MITKNENNGIFKKKLNPREYAGWIENEKKGLKVRRQQASYFYELQYQPLEYLVVIQERTEKIQKKVLKEELEKRGEFLYFTFKMSTEKGTGILSDKEIQFEDKDRYLLSKMQDDLMLLDGKDTLDCVMFYFEPSNNLIPYDQCVLAFEKPQRTKNDITFLYRTDKYLKGWVRMEIKRKNINKIPSLKTI